MYRIAAISLVALLAGCAATARVAVLQNPETKQTVECKITPMAGMNWSEQVDTCIVAYQKAGYVVLSDVTPQRQP